MAWNLPFTAENVCLSCLFPINVELVQRGESDVPLPGKASLAAGRSPTHLPLGSPGTFLKMPLSPRLKNTPTRSTVVCRHLTSLSSSQLMGCEVRADTCSDTAETSAVSRGSALMVAWREGVRNGSIKGYDSLLGYLLEYFILFGTPYRRERTVPG